MKKMLMVLMMVFGLSAIFADSYVAFTSKEGLALYNNNDQTAFHTFVKSVFESGTSCLTNQQKKNSTLIVVTDDQRAVHMVLVVKDEKKPNVYYVAVGNFYKDGNPDIDSIKGFTIETSLKTDPVIVGLSFIKEKVLQINNVDKEKVVYSMEVTD